VDLVKGKVVRLTKGKLEEMRVYYDDPVEAAREWEEEGADALHVVDIEAAMGIGENLEAIEKVLSSVSVEVQVAGGIRSVEKARRLVELGATRIVVGTRFIEKPEEVARIAKELGSSRVMVALDHRSGTVAVRGWVEQTGLDVYGMAVEAEKAGAGWILFTSVERDGTLSGLDLASLNRMVKSVKIPVVAAGGVASIEDIVNAAKSGAAGLVLGKALYEKRVKLSEALRKLEELGLRRSHRRGKP